MQIYLLSLRQVLKKYSLVNLLFGVIFFALLVLVILYQVKMLHFYEWADESETIVTAKMMAHGYRLYTEVFNNHGPLIFLPGLILEQFGSFGIAGHRVITLLLQLGLFAAIYFSPVLRNTNQFVKLSYLAVVGTITVCWFPILAFAQMYTYQVFAGIFTAIVLALYIIPVTINDRSVSAKSIIFCNALIVSLPFLAITFIPAAVLLLLTGIKRGQIRDQFFGIMLGLLGNCIFIALFASFEGFYAIHYYVSMKVMLSLQAKDLSLIAFLVEIYKAITLELHTFLMFSIIVLATGKLATYEKSFPLRAILILTAVTSYLNRGTGFQAVGFYYSFLVFPIVFLHNTQTIDVKVKAFTTLILFVCLIKLMALTDIDRFRLNERKISEHTLFADLAKRITSKNDRVLAFTYRNSEYIFADRLPASGNHHYFPWQAKFYEKPLFGISIDTCKDIEVNKPKIISTDFWTPIDSIPWLSYTHCIQDALKSNYSQVKNSNIWIRNDVFPADLQKQ